MATWKSLCLVILVIIAPSLQDLANNEVDDEDPLHEAKAAILKEQTLQNVGGLLNSFMHSDGAKELGNMLTNAATSENAGEILQGLGSILGQAKGIDPSILGMVMNMMQPQDGKKSEDSLDMDVIFSLMSNFFGQEQGDEKPNIWNYLPLILQTINSFVGPEAEKRAKSHADHSSLVPPIIEKIHILFDHFINSEMGKRVINTLGAEKFVRVFADEQGKMSYRRFVDMLENHSVRKHWIRMVTSKIASIVSHFSDPKLYRKYITTFQHLINSLLKSQGYPKAALFNPHRPTETISSAIDHFAKETLQVKINAKEYVKPIVEYVQELFQLAEQRGMLNVDSQGFSDKLADTINLEIIEPIARVNRAYRFALRVPKCDRYVMCLANQEPQDKTPSIPGLESLLSKTGSLIFSWFLSSKTKTPYLNFYVAITGGDQCQAYYEDACHDFHLEEIRVKREYVHSEL